MSGKIYITGTRGGLGSAIKSNLTSAYPSHQIIDLNRPEYDLSRVDGNLDRLVKDDFDLYVNCSHYGFSQVELLYRLFDQNKDRKCHIINIGSVSSDGDRKAINQYAIEKAALEKTCQQLSLVSDKCKVSLVKPGRMETKMVKHIEAPKMDPKNVAESVLWIASQPEHINIKSLTIDIMQDLK